MIFLAGHRLLAEKRADETRELGRELDVVCVSIRRMDRLAAAVAEEPNGERVAERRAHHFSRCRSRPCRLAPAFAGQVL